MTRAAVLCIGTELTRGEVVNTNASFLAEGLTTCGFEVTTIETVDDDGPRIEASLARLGQSHRVLVVTGGLGPTTDDITTACVARLLGVPLERDSVSLTKIEVRLARFGRVLSESNAKQADFPRGARILANDHGTAPGFCVSIADALAFFLPGVPREMSAMFHSAVVPSISPLIDEAIRQIRLRTYGLPESLVNDRLHGIEQEFGVVIGYRASFPTVEVKVLARESEPALAERKAQLAAAQVRARLGSAIFGEGDLTYAQALGAELVKRHFRMACAESCTGGLLGQLLTARSGSSAFFVGSAVVYDNAAKAAILGVDPALIEAHGAVSSQVARAMAEGARARFGVDLAVSITGIAGPDGGSEQKPVGLVHCASATRASISDERSVFVGDREQIRLRAAYAALALAFRVLGTQE